VTRDRETKSQQLSLPATTEPIADSEVLCCKMSWAILPKPQTNDLKAQVVRHLAQEIAQSRLIGDPKEVLDRHTKACALMLNTETLALIGSTFANNGINPKTHEKVLSSNYVRDVLSEMVINGIYERSGGWGFLLKAV
jgi:glutaminase